MFEVWFKLGTKKNGRKEGRKEKGVEIISSFDYISKRIICMENEVQIQLFYSPTHSYRETMILKNHLGVNR